MLKIHYSTAVTSTTMRSGLLATSQAV